jgi:acetyltransferase
MRSAVLGGGPHPRGAWNRRHAYSEVTEHTRIVQPVAAAIRPRPPVSIIGHTYDGFMDVLGSATELRGGIGHLLFPRSLAIVGASARRRPTIEAAMRGGSRAFGIHPRHASVHGLACYPSLADAPETPDLALAAVGHTRVEAVVEEAAAVGVPAVIVPGVGAEAGAEGPVIAARLSARAAHLGIALLGPNCMGVAVPGGLSAWLGSVPESVAPGHVSVVSQSGSVAEAMLTLGGRVGFRCVVSSGAEGNRDVADVVAFLADDEGTRTVGLFLETVRRPAAFLAALGRCAARGKPVVCLKTGRSDAAARAALAHTGALVGSHRAFTAAMRAYGVVLADDFAEFVEVLDVFGRSRRPRGARLGAVSESGGHGGLVADQAEEAGLRFASLDPALAGQLQAEFPNFTAPGNPLDAWGIDEPERVFPRALSLMAASGDYDILLAQVDVSQFRGAPEYRWCSMVVRALSQAVEGTGVLPVVVTVQTGDPWPEMAALARECDIPLLRGPRAAMRALAAAARWRPVTPPQPVCDLVPDHETVKASGVLAEAESAALLARYGVPMVDTRRACSADDASDLADSLGYPVVVKVDGVAHKRAAGGVILGCRDAEDVRAATAELGGRVVVARQLDPGPEVICGMLRDEGFGPILAIGLGGTLVEGLDTVVTALAPVDQELALQLVGEVPGLRRVASGRALDDLAATLVAIGRLALARPAVSEIDVNPLILSEAGAVAVDALVVIDDPGGAEGPSAIDHHRF